MMNKFIHSILILLLCFSCGRQQKHDKTLVFNPLTIESNGYIVPADSMEIPKTIPAGKPISTPVSKPTVVYTNDNERPAKKPKVILAGIPRVITPGQDSVLIPKTLPAINNPIVAGIPEVEIVKDAYIKDQNAQNFSTFGKHQGLKYSSINCQLQDQSGNIWFCTYGGGVSKYDGKSFTHYTENEGLSNNRVWSVLQDKEGNLWFGTDGGGVSKYDGQWFTNYTEKEGLLNNSVLSILQDKNGNIWFATVAGVSRYDGKSFTHFTEKEGLANNTVLSIFQDKDRNIWFGTGEGGVSKYDGKSFTNFTVKEGLPSNSISSIIQDTSGNLWFGTYGGVSRYDGKSFLNFTEQEGLSNNKVYSVLQDIDGIFWFGTYGGGVSKLVLNENEVYDPKLHSTVVGHFTHFSVSEGLSNDIVFSILQDKSDNLWFGTNGGVSKYGGKLFTHFTREEGLSNTKVYSILTDKKGDLWLGTFGGGVSRYDGQSFTHFSEKEGLTNSKIFSIVQDQNGNLWFGTDGSGAFKYDGKSFTNYTTKEGLSNNKVYSILEDETGNLWFGTYGGGVSKFDGRSFTHFTKKEGLCNNYVLCIFQDRIGNIWLGTDGGGVSKLRLDSTKENSGKSLIEPLKYSFTNFTTKEGLSHNYIFSISQDKYENMWFGTGGGGASRYDGKSFTHFTEKEGLDNEFVLSIFRDKTDNLWFGTRFGLYKLNAKNSNLKSENPKLPLFKNYGYEDGFLGIGCNRGAIDQDHSGTIWIGTNDRLTAYHPGGDKADTIPPNIQLTGLEIFNEKISWSDLLHPTSAKQNRFEVKDTSIVLGNGVTVTDFDFNETTKWYGIPLDLSLKYNNNFLTFSFIGITQTQSKKVKYKHQLVGLDENWSATTLSNEASYSNLSPGSYTFKVKAVNSEGDWSNEFTYFFTIRPPWWESGWFRLLMVVFVIAGLLIFYRWRIDSLKKRQKHLERIVGEKTAKVVKQSKELRAINEELTQQKEELEIANATKDKFFSIIAHDLRSPFNGFLGLTEIMAEELSSLSLTDIQNLALSMKKSANNLHHLLENLLQWSQLQKGALRFNPEVCRLRSLAEVSIAVITEPAKNKGIKLVNKIPEGLDVLADCNMLQAIIRNLASNALKFTPKGGKITISAQSLEDDGIEVSIQDTGIGMNPDLLSKLFLIDEKISRKGTNDEPSTGLGLILCKEFVEKHQGMIWVESEVGKGSIFYFTIYGQKQKEKIQQT